MKINRDDLAFALSEERRIRKEEASHPISIPLALRAAFRPSMIEAPEIKSHVDDCPRCLRRLNLARQEAKPEWADLLLFIANRLPAMDRECISRYMERFPTDGISSLAASLNRWPEWFASVSGLGRAQVTSLAAPAPLVGHAYAGSSLPAALYSADIAADGFEVHIEQQTGDVLFVAVRVPGTATPKEVWLALLHGGNSIELRLPATMGQFWTSTAYVERASDFLHGQGEISVLILPIDPAATS